MPVVTWLLIAANVLIFLTYWTSFPDPHDLNRFLFDWGLVPRLATTEPQTYVTSMFLHGGIMHLLGNMLFLWIFGDNLEDELGHLGFLVFYLAAGLAAAGAQVWSDPNSAVPMVGASGAIAGVMGGYLLIYPKARVDILIFLIVYIRILPVPAWIVLLSWFVIQILQGIVIPAEGGGVAHWAHAGGFAAGVILALPFWIRRGAAGYWKRTNGQPPYPETRYRYVKSDVPVVRRHRIARPASPWTRR